MERFAECVLLATRYFNEKLLQNVGFSSTATMYSQSDFLSVGILTSVGVELLDTASKTPFVFKRRPKDPVVGKKHDSQRTIEGYN